jgi:hypothetical protein
VELNYQVRTEWLSGIRRRINEGAIAVSSVHNVFPKTLDKKFDTDSIMLGYEDEALRQQAVELAKGSIEWACVLGAGAVVFHPTEVPMDPREYDVPLKKMIAAHQQDTPEYKALHAKMVAARQSQPYIDRMMKSIDELAEYVTKFNLPVKLGMENRAMCHQCPIYSEFDMIADRAFYLEVVSATQPNPELEYPRVSFENARVPDQYDPDAVPADDGSIFDEIMDEFGEFDGDDSYDDEY